MYSRDCKLRILTRGTALPPTGMKTYCKSRKRKPLPSFFRLRRGFFCYTIECSTEMRLPRTSICSPLRCSRTSPTSWPSTQILPSRTARRSGRMNSAPSPSTGRCFSYAQIQERRYAMAASRIKGITVEIGGDTTKLQSALKGVNAELRHLRMVTSQRSSMMPDNIIPLYLIFCFNG